MNYSKALKVARAISGLQQKELAERAELDASYLSLIELGKRKPSLSAIDKLSRALGIPQHLFVLLASEADDLSIADPIELQRAAESLARYLISGMGIKHGQEPDSDAGSQR
jgi:transcriptional regulator with XRE-family HTH domain